MNDTFLQVSSSSLKGDGKGVGDNPHLQQLQLLTNQMNGNAKSISSSNLNPLINFSSSNSLLSTSLSSSLSLCNGHSVASSSGSSSNPNSNSCGNSFKEDDKKLKDSFAIEVSTGLQSDGDHLIACSTGAPASSLASNTLTALNSSMINTSLNSPKAPCNAFEPPFFNFSNNIIAESVRISNSATSDYFITQFNDDNPVEAPDCLLNKSNNYCQFSPPITGHQYEPFHTLTSNPLANYNGQMSTSSFLNNISSMNSSSLNSSHLLTNLQSHSLLADDNLGQTTGYESHISLNSSLQLPNLTNANASTNGYSFHNLQNLDPLTAQSAHSQLEMRGNQPNLESSPSPPSASASGSNQQPNHQSTGSAGSNSGITFSISSIQFTPEQISATIKIMLKDKSFENLNNFLETIKLTQSNALHDRSNENSNSPADTSNSNEITNGQENNLSGHLQFGNLNCNPIDLHSYRSNAHYSGGGQSLALSTITNAYNSNGMQPHHHLNHSLYNSTGNQAGQLSQSAAGHQPATNDIIRSAADVFLLKQLPFDRRTNEHILVARAHLEFYRLAFENLKRILSENAFSFEHHLSLQKLWHEAHYKESEKSRDRKLGAVDKYRIRKKYIFPSTIWDGENRVYCFKEKSRQALRDCYKLNK